MTEQHDAEALAAAKSLTGALKDMTGELARLRRYGVRNRQMIWGLIVSIALDLILTAFIAVTAIQAHEASAAAASAKFAESALCQAGNVARAQQVQLWDHLLTLPPAKGAPPRTAAQEAEAAAFGRYVRSVFASRDCAALGRR